MKPMNPRSAASNDSYFPDSRIGASLKPARGRLMVERSEQLPRFANRGLIEAGVAPPMV